MTLRRLFNFADPGKLAHNPLGLHPWIIENGADAAFGMKPWGAPDAWSLDELLDAVPSTLFNRMLGVWSQVERGSCGVTAVTGNRDRIDMRGFESIGLLKKYVPDIVEAVRKRTQDSREVRQRCSVRRARVLSVRSR